MKHSMEWYSERVGQGVRLVRWGYYGTPVLLFPTAGGDAEEVERFQLIDAIWPLIDAGRIKVYSCDSLAGQAWISRRHPPEHCCWLQNQYDALVYQEFVPAIRTDCQMPAIEIVVAGASIGAFNAVASLCRHPDVFKIAIGMSGTYDLERLFNFQSNADFYYSSPLLYLPNLPEGPQLEALRRRFALLAYVQGRWEDPGETWRMAHALGSRGVPNRVDAWGPEYDHDWPAWRAMLPKYLQEFI